MKKAVGRLKAVRAKRKVLRVPVRDAPKAGVVMRGLGVRGIVRKLGGTRKRQARKSYRSFKRS
jgi:hypothetical protein